MFKEIISGLKDEGFNLEYTELVNVPHSKVLNEIQQCDFVLDELYSDLPLAGFSSEAAFYSKPSIIGSYLANSFDKFIPKDMIPPSLVSLPEEVESNVRLLIENIEFRKNTGDELKDFMNTNWSSESVAKKYISLIMDDYPESWNSSAQDVDYIHGWGISESNLKTFLKDYMCRFGESGLFVDDKPILVEKIKKFVS